MKLLICLLFFGFFCMSASSKINKQVIGGKPSSIAYYPYLAHLEVGGFVCSASIIGNRWLLTSGYCSHWHNKVQDWVAVVGTQRLDFVGSRHKVVKWVRHPKFYYDKQDYDFALINVEPDMFSESVVAAAIGLPRQDEPTPHIGDAVVCGFGQVYPDVNEMSNKFHVAIMKTYPDDGCQDNLWKRYTPRLLCAREYRGEISVSANDVGAPLVINKTLYGVSQPKYNHYYQDIKGIKTFARVASVRNWIKDVAKI